METKLTGISSPIFQGTRQSCFSGISLFGLSPHLPSRHRLEWRLLHWSACQSQAYAHFGFETVSTSPAETRGQQWI